MSAATAPMPHAGQGPAAGAPPRRRGRDLLAWLTLALATLAILWPLGLTHRVLAGVDALTYFTPYWAYRMAELRAGHLPLWNPYLFLGVPFLANPQAAVLYPLHWPLSWLRPEQALVWSALLHVWLAAGFTYTFARRSLGLQPAGRLAGGTDLRPGWVHAGPRREHQPAQRPGLAARAAVALRRDGARRERTIAHPLGRRVGRRHRAATAGRTHADDVCEHGRAGAVGRVAGLGWRVERVAEERRRRGDEETRRRGDGDTANRGRTTNGLHGCATPCCRCWRSFRRFCSPRRNYCRRWN